MSDLPIVTDPYAVDAAWLTAALNRAGVAAQVEGFTTQKVGDGMLGESVRYNLAYAAPAPGAPASVVGKFPSADPVSRATGGAIGLYLNEVRFYQEVAHTVDIRTPRPYVAAINTETHDFTLLLEDMGPARGGNQLVGCSLADAEVAMREAAALHGPRWADPKLGDVEFLNRPAIEPAAISAMFGGVITAFRARYEDRLEPEYMAICQDFADHIGAFYAGPAAPPTLQHLDFRLDNMLFEPQGGRWPLAVLDWQSVALGPGVLDVAYFIGAGLPTEIRRKHEQDLLKQWLGALRGYGVSYDWNDAWTAYRHYLLQGVFTAIFASVSTKQTERGDQMFLTMARRHCAQAADLESMKLLRRA
ncbi:MAG: phosphotransferase [Phenylobacterium sp.]|uniref:phosphotransferase family protein n=1 Tax=Phenylobacterium sp. TaxID=1871053 RepID=UPI001B5422D6|nr:phosphotransferase [Phenylobacterium sp.]MBP7816330.1 phosphotransferase [Phenylobacterium sp.]